MAIPLLNKYYFISWDVNDVPRSEFTNSGMLNTVERYFNFDITVSDERSEHDKQTGILNTLPQLLECIDSLKKIMLQRIPGKI